MYRGRRGARQGLSLGKCSQVGRCRRQCRLDRQGMEVGGVGSLLHSSREEWKVRRPSHLPERPILRKLTQWKRLRGCGMKAVSTDLLWKGVEKQEGMGSRGKRRNPYIRQTEKRIIN